MQFRSMDSAPRDRAVLALCLHDADPLTVYVEVPEEQEKLKAVQDEMESLVTTDDNGNLIINPNHMSRFTELMAQEKDIRARSVIAKLTPYGTWSKLHGHVSDGLHVVHWSEFTPTPWWISTYVKVEGWPIAANPILWCDIPDQDMIDHILGYTTSEIINNPKDKLTIASVNKETDNGTV